MRYGNKIEHEVKPNFMISALVAALAAPLCAAGVSIGLGVRFPDLVMENVDPGLVVNLRQDRNIPYIVINKTDGPVDVSVQAELPTGKNLKEGYQPIPKADWLKVVPGRFHLEKGELASADVILAIPNDAALVGHHYQVNIMAQTVGKGFLAAGVMHTVRFSVGTPGPDTLKHEAALKSLETLDLDLTPQTLEAAGVALGKEMALKPLKLTNRSADVVKLRLDSVAVDNELKRAGYDAGDPSWLKVKPVSFKAKPDTISTVELSVKIPDEAGNRGRKFMFVVRAELEEMSIPLAINSRIYVTTEGEAVKKE